MVSNLLKSDTKKKMFINPFTAMQEAESDTFISPQQFSPRD